MLRPTFFFFKDKIKISHFPLERMDKNCFLFSFFFSSFFFNDQRWPQSGLDPFRWASLWDILNFRWIFFVWIPSFSWSNPFSYHGGMQKLEDEISHLCQRGMTGKKCFIPNRSLVAGYPSFHTRSFIKEAAKVLSHAAFMLLIST